MNVQTEKQTGMKQNRKNANGWLGLNGNKIFNTILIQCQSKPKKYKYKNVQRNIVREYNIACDVIVMQCGSIDIISYHAVSL